MKQQADQWYSDFIKLMKYSKNAQYGRTECFRCLLSPDREEAAIFMGINKVISRALDANGVSVYPCKVLNRFACPYDKNSTNYTGKDDNTKRPDVDYLFYLSEIAFAVELALAKATEQDSIFKIRSVQPMPNHYKDYNGNHFLKLSSNKETLYTESSESVSSLLLRRRTIRKFENKNISFDQFSRILLLTWGKTASIEEG